MILGLLAAVVALSAYRLFSWWRELKPLREAAAKFDGPPTLPFVGNGLLFLGGNDHVLRTLERMFIKYKAHLNPVRMWLGSRLYFLVSCPDHIATVINAPESMAKDAKYDYAQAWLGEGLFTAPMQKWRRHRRVIMPTFNQRILDTFVPVFVERTAELVKILRPIADGRTIDCFHPISLCSLDIVCETVMGVSVGAQVDKDCDYVKASQIVLTIVMQRIIKVWLSYPLFFKFSGLERKQDKGIKILHDFSKKVVHMKMQKETRNSEEKPPARKSFLDHIIAITQEPGEKAWSQQEFREEVDTMIVTGSDTSASMVSFIMMVLGMFPDIQEKVVDELRDICGSERLKISVDDLPRMAYMELVIKESMRLFPVGPVIVRAVTRDLKLTNDITLPRGSGIVVGIRDVQRNKVYWGPDADEFRPERFLPENSVGRHPYMYLPFSGGPRNCAGQRYAMMSMKVMLAAMLRHYRIGCDYKMEEIPLKIDLMLRPKNGYNISLLPRDNF